MMTDALSHVVKLPVLGVSTTFATNSDAILEAVLALYGSWAALDAALVSPSSAIVKIRECSDDVLPNNAPLRYHVPEPARMTVEGAGSQGVADRTRLESLVIVNPGTVARSSEFGENIVEPLTLFLLGFLDRMPLHAAGVVRDQVSILLAGPSGAGKSTLAYAACRKGYSLLADEPVYVQTQPVLRVWGRRARIHLRAEASTHFPELREHATRRLQSGKDKVVIDLPSGPRHADRMGICIVNRAAGPTTEIERLSVEQVCDELASALDPGYNLFADVLPNRLARIAERGAWRIHVGHSPAAAVAFLDALVAELAAR